MNFLSKWLRKFSEQNIKTVREVERELADYQMSEGVEAAGVMGLSELLEWQRTAGVRLIEIAVLSGASLSDPAALVCCDWTGLREFFERMEDLPADCGTEAMLALARDIDARKPRLRVPDGYAPYEVVM
jgi:hypothetical protein